MWHEEFSDDLRNICREIAKGPVELARKAGIPAPDDLFQPDDKQEVSERSETRLIAESGADSFYVDSTRNRTPFGSTHRWQIRKLSIEEMRRQHRQTTKRLIEQARRNGGLVGKLWAAIDVTKESPFTGELDTDEDGNIVEPYILGRRGGNYYHQWASIQIVGHDVPIVLDGLPKKRGITKDEIVDELLDHATEMVDDIDLVMMDREFDSDPVKDI